MIRSAKAVIWMLLVVCVFGCQPPEDSVVSPRPTAEAEAAPKVSGGMPGKSRPVERAMANPGMDPNGSMAALQRTRPDPNPKRRAEPISLTVDVAPEATGAGKLKTDGALVEIAGACDVTANAVTCWKPDGTPNEALSKLVKAALKQPERKFQRSEFSNNDPNALKVRGVAVKVTPGSGRASSLMAIVNDDSASPLSRRPFAAEGVKYGLAVVRTDPNETLTSISVALSNPTSVKGEVECEEAAKGTFDGQEFGVTSIREAAARIMAGPGEVPTPASAWRISLRFTDPTHNYENVTLEPLDKAGHPILFTDETGHPAKKGRPSVSAALAQRDGTLIFTTTVLPSKVGKLVLKGNRVKVVELTGVRLDPLK